MGESSCILYNLHVAPSITTQARSCISAAGLQFEMFLANGSKFDSFNEVITFIDNIRSEVNEREYDDNLLLDNDISIEDCLAKLVLSCGFNYVPTEDELEVLWEMLNNISQQDINRIYYKNNLYEFMENKSMQRAIIHLLKSLKVPYLDPNESPEEIEVELEEFQSILMEYVYYHHQLIDRIDKYHYMVRSTGIITDKNLVASF